MKTCGIVGQPEIADSSCADRGSGRTSTVVTGAPTARRASSARPELPQAMKLGVPFMKSDDRLGLDDALDPVAKLVLHSTLPLVRDSQLVDRPVGERLLRARRRRAGAGRRARARRRPASRRRPGSGRPCRSGRGRRARRRPGRPAGGGSRDDRPPRDIMPAGKEAARGRLRGGCRRGRRSSGADERLARARASENGFRR